ncbi:hypothetical protein LOTGIDRAFT_231732 [Lottia gigantea]|uniref:Uncharacterized protein n=1 Tax=Lottia gigantea TaxID=225164 RepID=V4C5R1_LOTGI|nr:hypothetical protein LOTGIDRAFT_231732 [Lottia gigantea]ESO96944.1 hypothetical protein LOTGIDRAFT_231732 [Lottia gigantea]
MYFDEELKVPSAVQRIGHSLSGKQKAVIFAVASLAVGFFLYKSWSSWKQGNEEDSEFYSLQPSNSPRQKRILVVGLENTGKTTFVRRFCKRQNGSNSSEENSFGQYIKQHSVKVGDLSITMWDVCGAVENREIWHDVFRLEEVDFIIFCVDSSSQHTFVEARKELHRFLKIKVFKQTPLILLATKQDKSSAVDPYALYLSMNLENFQGSRPILTTGIQVSTFGQSKGFMELYNLLSTIDE